MSQLGVRRLALAGLALAMLSIDPQPAAAAPVDPVLAAERAYEKVDFATQLAEATRALEQGGHDPKTLASIYRLIGIAHAALGAPDAAKQDFMRLLAIDPDVALEQMLSPRLRTPYLEARGYWDVNRSRLELTLGFDVTSGALTLELTDPLAMAERVRVLVAAEPRESVAELDAAPALVVAAPALAAHAGRRLQVELLDAHENVLQQRRLTLPTPAAPAGASQARSPSPPFRADSAPPTLSLVLGAGALLALGTGITAHVIRENEAHEWNGTDCEQIGRGSRSEQCGNVDDQRRVAQTVAVFGYAASGALLASSVVSYLLSSRREHEPRPAGSLACGTSSEGWGLSCNTTW